MICNFDLSAFAAGCGVKDNAGFVEKCAALHQHLVEYNAKVNLTRLTSKKDFYLKHVADSLSIARFFPELTTDTFAMADIGCGAGFPSLVLALAFPRLQITAIDSIGKKISFVREAADRLGLTNITPIHGRSVELNCKKEYQHRFDIVTARAVAPSPKICKEASRFLKKNGRYIFYKTPQQSAEEAPLLKEMKNMQWHNTPLFALPEDDGERVFTVGKFINHQ